MFICRSWLLQNGEANSFHNEIIGNIRAKKLMGLHQGRSQLNTLGEGKGKTFYGENRIFLVRDVNSRPSEPFNAAHERF